MKIKLEPFALNQGTLSNVSLDEFLTIASDSGYQGVGLWFDCVEKYRGSACDVIKASKLNIIELTFRGPWLFVDKQEKSLMLDHFERACHLAKSINAHFICLPAYGEKNGDLLYGTRNFIELCELAKKYGLKLGIENLPWSSLDTILSAWKFIEASKQKNAGVVVDAFQFFKSNSQLEDLNQIPVNNICAVHIRDSSDKDNNIDLLTQAREYGLFPGEGDFDLKGLVAQLQHMDYQGYYSLEVLNNKFKKMTPNEIAKKGIRTLKNIINYTIVFKEH